MVALGDHLGAHQNVQVFGGKVLEHLEGPAAMGRGVPVQASHSGFRPQTAHFALHPFRTHPMLFYGRGLAGWAALGHVFFIAAVMADQAVPGVVLGQGHAALFTLENVAAEKTEKHGGVTPAVEKKESLLSPLQGFSDCSDQRWGDDLQACAAPVLLPVLAQVFEGAGCLERLENFCSVYGAEFYGLSLNEDKVALNRNDWVVPELLNGAVPFLAGETVSWELA